MDMSPSPSSFKTKAKALCATSGNSGVNTRRSIDYAPPTEVWIPEVPPVSTEISHSYIVLSQPKAGPKFYLREDAKWKPILKETKKHVTPKVLYVQRELTIHLYQEF